MFKRITIVFVMSFLAVSARAQFSIDKDTIYTEGYVATDPDDVANLIAHGRIFHTNSPVEWIKWIRIDNSIPQGWSTAVCDIISCKSPDTDTGSFEFGAGDIGDISFYFYPEVKKGTGSMTVRFYRASNPLEYEDVVIIGTAWGLGLSPLNSSVTRIYPNPSANFARIDNHTIDSGLCEVFNSLRQLVLQLPFVNHMQLDLSALDPGVYTVKISGSDAVSYSKLTKE